MRQKQLTVLSAPILELNRVAVTTLLLLASTAPTARSGVSITATSFGGAVRTAARPNLNGKPPGFGPVPELGDGFNGASVLVAEVLSDNLPFVMGVGGANEVRRVNDVEEVERERDELVRGRPIANADGGWDAARSLGTSFTSGWGTSPSVQRRCRMTDLVAH